MQIKKKEVSKELINEYVKSVKINKFLAEILIKRNIDVATAGKIINNPKSLISDSSLLINVDKACNQIINAVNNNYEIWVFADYDADGITSGFIMYDFLINTTNNKIFPYFPERDEEYGMSMDFCEKIVQRAKEEGINNTLIITVDNGTSCVEQVKYLNSNGIEVIVTDHHKAGVDIAECTIVNPQLDSNKIYHCLSGAGVAFKLINYMCNKLGADEELSLKYLYAVAIGTIADVMPMTIENMALCKAGLDQMNSSDCPKQIKELKKCLRLFRVNSKNIAWEIAPRINACGRMGNVNAAALFFMKDSKKEIIEQIEEMDKLNKERKKLTDKMMKEVDKQNFEKDKVCIFNPSDCPKGLIGIIAGKISEKNNKPAIVLAGDGEDLVGSARSIEGIDIQKIFKEESILEKSGGHSMAAGMAIKKENIEEFKKSIEKTIGEIIEKDESVKKKYEDKEDTIEIDCDIEINNINNDLYDSVFSIPYGRNEFREPIFRVKNLKLEDYSLSKNKPENIKLTLEDEVKQKKDIWVWKLGEKISEIKGYSKLNIIGEIDKDFTNPSLCTLKIIEIMDADKDGID